MTSERDHRDKRSNRAKPATARIDRIARDRLGRDLRLFYAGVLDQPLPHRFTRLLDTLAGRSGGTAEDVPDDTNPSHSREGSR